MAIGIGHLSALIISIIESRIYKDLFNLSINKKLTKKLLLYSIPLIPNALSWWLIDLGNRYIIKYALGSEANGLYAVAARYVVLIAFLNSFFLMLWQDYFLSSKMNLDRNPAKLYALIKIQIVILLIVTSFSYALIDFGAGKEFQEAFPFIGLICLSSMVSFLAALIGVEFLLYEKTSFLFKSTLIGGLTNVLLSIFTIDYLGLYGVVFGSFFGFLITLILRLRKSKVISKNLHISPKILMLFLFAFSFVFALQFLKDTRLSILLGVTLSILAVYYYKKLFLSLLKKIK